MESLAEISLSCSLLLLLLLFRHVIEELLQTEEAYVKDLKLIVDVSKGLCVLYEKRACNCES